LPEIIDTYRTLKSPSEGIYKEKGSKFLAFAFPVNTEEDIKEKLAEIRKAYYDARHHCYAWVLGADKSRYRANDDGEPSNSAGKPILGKLQSHDLSQVLIIVVRYFGGVKLGVGGLINAYRSAADDAILNGVIVQRKMKTFFEIHFRYDAMNDVMTIIKSKKIEQLSHLFELDCKIKLAVPQSEFKSISEAFLKIEGVEITVN
jgi:uncharacterized YigZ family protein